MKFISPPQKLDARIIYSVEEARSYLLGLSDQDRSKYFYSEILDYWYMVNYSWIFYLGMNYFHPGLKRRWISIFGGVLDFLETSLIMLFLITGEFGLFHEFLPYFSTPKWFLGLGVGVYLILKKWRTASL